ncbi:MAG: hypothetical protein RL732_72 [Bacteroidota bacterium]
MKNIYIVLLIISSGIAADAQRPSRLSDPAKRDTLEEVVVTATRNERVLTNVAVPVSIISQKTIQRAGSLRLRDILQEQTGLFLTSGFGTGVQMQGLNPDYTLILIDGEPLVGRTAGVLDLNRITVGNIRKVEIVKGPSSSLYGSEALAGVINIITDKTYANKLTTGLRYGSYNTLDANVQASARRDKLGASFFLNHYRTDGYSIRPFSVERSKLPVSRLTPQVKLNYTISPRTGLSLSVRLNQEEIRNELAVSNNGQIVYSKGKEVNKDLNVMPTLTHQLNNHLKTALRLYGTRFEGVQQLNTTSGLNYEDYFRQQFYRVENQTDFTPIKELSIIGGAGFIREKVNSTRYDSKDRVKENEVKYGFLQADWKPFHKVTIIAGLRYDDNKVYASVFSPKIAAQYSVSENFRFQFSFGQGFKAPDFRQLYLNFTNSAAGGYSVYGSLEAQRVIALQQQSSLIRELSDDYYRLQQLRPEFSNGYNAGFNWKISTHLQWQANVFRNDIRDLIESRLVATRVDNSQIFSYINIKNALTQGVETSLRYSWDNGLVVEGGYQLLYTADKTEWQRLKSGGYYFTRDANNFSIPLRKQDYIGLPNRSRHMANLKITYEQAEKHCFVTLRNMYRSQWAVFDRDGNGIYNKQDDFAKGFLLMNISAGKEFDSGITLMAGSDNLTDHVDANNLPNMPGRTGYVSFQYSFTGRKKQ